MSLLSKILWRGVRHPLRVCIVDDLRTSTYLRFTLACFYLARLIREQTTRKNVGLMLPTSGAMPAAVLGAWQAGKVAVPFNYLLGNEELRYCIEHSDVDTLITATPLLEFIGGRDKLPESLNVVCADKIKFGGIPPLRWPRNPDDNETAVILYSSGTSGKPKGIELTHGNLRLDVEMAINHAQLRQADTFLGVLPQFHSFGLTSLTLIPLSMGSKIVYTARFVPKKILDLAREHRPDIFMGVPSMYNALLTVKSATPDDMKSVRMPISGGEPLPQAVYDGCVEKLGIRLLEGYGLTETAPVVSWNTPELNRRGSVGKVLPGIDVIIVDDLLNPVPVNTDGEILIHGPNVMPGYYKAPELTAEVMVELPHPTPTSPKKRFFRTGDIGKLDDDGFLYITGRKKEMLIIGGLNVFPRDIEEVLNRHESVKDSCVIGRPDPSRGEVAVAYVELNEGAHFDAAALKNWCAATLAGYKVPRSIHQVLTLPRSPTGKLLRRKVKEMVNAGEVPG